VKWAGHLLKNPETLLKGAASLPLEAISDATEEGRLILNSARTILAHLGKTDAQEITIEDTTDTAKILAQTKFNGDGSCRWRPRPTTPPGPSSRTSSPAWGRKPTDPASLALAR